MRIVKMYIFSDLDSIKTDVLKHSLKKIMCDYNRNRKDLFKYVFMPNLENLNILLINIHN